MKLNKKLVTLAAAGALGALTALPAMAFENEFHGSYVLKYYLSNYEQGGGGNPLAVDTAATTVKAAVPAGFTVAADGTIKGVPAVAAVTSANPTFGYIKAPVGNTTNNLKANNYFEARARIFYTAKASDDLKLVTAFEIDSVFGDRAQGATFRNSGAALESDAVNLETKWVYLQFKIPSTPTTVLAGVMPFKDNIKGILADFDAAGVVTATKLGNATVVAGYFRGYDGSFTGNGVDNNIAKTDILGRQDLNIGALEFKYAISKDVNVGLDYYVYEDGRNLLGATSDVILHTFGLYGDAKLGAVTLSGFAAYQGGVLRNIGNSVTDSAYQNALAYNVAAKAAVGPGTLKTALLFTSGDNQAANHKNHMTGWIGTSQSQNATWNATAGTSSYNESGMMLLNRNALAQGGTTDVSLAYNTGNGSSPVNSQGMYLYSLGYDANITPKAFVNTNLGFLWTAKTNSLKPLDRNTGKQNGTNFQGAELNLEVGYKLYDNLTAKLQAAYVMLGGYYKGSSAYTTVLGGATDPENPYTTRIVLSYAF